MVWGLLKLAVEGSAVEEQSCEGLAALSGQGAQAEQVNIAREGGAEQGQGARDMGEDFRGEGSEGDVWRVQQSVQ